MAKAGRLETVGADIYKAIYKDIYNVPDAVLCTVKTFLQWTQETEVQ